MNNKTLGSLGEDAACSYLETKGYLIKERNFRNKLGEIDIVAIKGKVVCFVEVKTRLSTQYGEPFESVTHHKQKKMVQMALSYLKFRYRTTDILSRFDVISIVVTEGKYRIQHIEDAFDLTYLSH